MRLKLRSTVLLPHPDGPIMAVILLRSTAIVDIANGKKIPVIDVQIPCDNGMAIVRRVRRLGRVHRWHGS